MKKILITGASGFIAPHIVEKALEKDFKVFGVDILEDEKNISNKNYEFIRKDVRDLDLEFLKDIDYVVHLAFVTNIPNSIQNPVDTTKDNIDMTVFLLKLSANAGVKKFLFPSTGSLYGNNPIPWTDDHTNNTYSTEMECYCGKKGCIETFLSGAGLVKTYENLGVKSLASTITTPELIVKKLEDGDHLAQKCLEIYASRLARSLAYVINLVDPGAIILGGGLSNISYLYETIPELLKRWVFTSELSTPLLKNQHGDSSGVRGAAWLWP